MNSKTNTEKTENPGKCFKWLSLRFPFVTVNATKTPGVYTKTAS